MIKVFHSRDDLTKNQRTALIGFDDGFIANVVALWNAGGYEQVAEIASDDLEVAWRWTNNVDTSWSMEPERRVTLKAPLHIIDGHAYGRRSSMVGDVFFLNGVAHVVATMGFTPLPDVKLPE